MSEDGRFFRHAAQGAPVSCNSRYATPQYLRKQKDWLRLSLFSAVFADLQFELSEPFVRLGPLAEGWFLSPKAASRLRPLTHTSFCLTLQS